MGNIPASTKMALKAMKRTKMMRDSMIEKLELKRRTKTRSTRGGIRHQVKAAQLTASVS